MRPSFIEYINQSNRELFHSRSIAWLINNDSSFAKTFIKKVAGIDEEQIDSFLAYNELEQIDILIVFTTVNHPNIHFIHVENKLKSIESDKKLSDKERMSLGIKKGDREAFSQTEYYFLRRSLISTQKKIYDKINGRNENEKPIFDIDLDQLKNKENWHFVFLTPGGDIKNSKKKTNRWNLEDFFKEENPWNTFSYESLILKSLEHIEQPASVVEYKNYLKKELSRERAFFNEKRCEISLTNLVESLNGNRQILESYIVEQKLLALQDIEILKPEEYRDVLNKFSYKIGGYEDFQPYLCNEFKPGSSNNPSYIFQSFFVFDGFKFSSTKYGKVRIGYQYEQKGTQGRIKLFIAAFDYDNVTIEKSEIQNYIERCRNEVVNSPGFLNKLKKSKETFFENSSKGTPSTKTFISLLSDIPDFKDEEGLIKIFRDRLLCLIHDFRYNIKDQDVEDLFMPPPAK